MNAEERIREALRTGNTSLDLSGLQLTALPDALAQLTNLQSLNLSFNQLTALPDALAQLTKLQSLDLRGNQLTALPDALAQLTNLQSLDLSDNKLTALPDALAQLTNLRYLDLSFSQLTALPDALAQLTNLRSLHLRGNQLTDLPDALAQLTNLQSLGLSGNQLTTLPGALAQLTNLRYLDLRRNQLTALPRALAQLTNLQDLYLSGNRLTALADALAQLTNLQFLDLSFNQLTALPGALAQLTNLQSLDLSGNQLTALPDALAQLTKLQYLHLRRNQLTALPGALAQLTNLRLLDLDDNPLPDEWQAAISRGDSIAYLRSLTADEKPVSPRAVKVILLGEPQSGKTTLREALMGNPNPCDPDRKETIGVDIVPVPVPHPIDGQEMYLNLWDFAGQQIEHATHQFFLTSGALYLILWNSRQGADSGKRDVYYWLELLRMRVPNARFLLVATHADRTPPDLPWPDIRDLSGDSFQGHPDVDFLDLRGFDTLRETILRLAAESPSISALWNRKWLAVRDRVRALKKEHRYMDPARFRQLMEAEGVTDSGAQRTLAGHLHELGEILCNVDRPELADFVLLDCEWVTELVGRVSRSSAVRRNGGVLRREDLDAIWPDHEVPPALRGHLLKLMDNFDLSYDTRQPDELGIVVEALPPYAGEPLPEWEARQGEPEVSLVLEFRKLYRRLPPGIPTWGIARAHRYSLRKPWRDLALFEHRDRDGGSSLGMIQADNIQRRVFVRVRSHYPPYLHSILRNILDDTIRRYPGLEVVESAPCRCQPGCSWSYPLKFLESMRQQNQPVYCQNSSKPQDPLSLLTGLVPAAPFEEKVGSEQTILAELRRQETARIRGQQSFYESSCPSIFQLMPRRDRPLLDNMLEYLRKGEPWRLTLYCEWDDRWHVTEYGVYDFDLHADWIENLRGSWNSFAYRMQTLAPLIRATGTLTGQVKLQALGLATEKLRGIPADARALQMELGAAYDPHRVDIELRRTLRHLIDELDSTRPHSAKCGGLHKCLNADGRTLWLCPDHYRTLQSRQ